MSTKLSDDRERRLRAIFERGAEGASSALSRWLGTPVRLSVSGIEQADLSEAAEALGPPETLVAACAMGLTGPLGGSILLAFEDRAGLALADLLLKRPIGTAVEWGELERSAAMETTNIVGCAYLNAMAAQLPTAGEELTPTPPNFLREFAGSLLQFALMEQAMEFDQVLLARAAFDSGRSDLNLNWTLLLIPDRRSLRALTEGLADEPRHP